MEGGFRLALAGDVMTGRGIDQILPHPAAPQLQERWVKDARCYVTLAEDLNGPVPRPAGYGYPWGETLAALETFAPDAAVMNLETSVTATGAPAPGKGIHYRMSPGNLDTLRCPGAVVWSLANNHVLDHGREGLESTLRALADAGLSATGAGRDLHEAWRPAEAPTEGRARARVLGVAHGSSGTPSGWAAGEARSGVALLPDLSAATAERVALRVRSTRPGRGPAVVSVHWGSNWGYRVGADEVRFARRLVDLGVDVVHGHSSHHPRPLEVYRGRLVLYGCGDLLSDYEGISGYDEYRGELRLLYLCTLASGGALRELRMVPFRSHRLRLERTSPSDARWLARTLEHASHPFGTTVRLAADGELVVALKTPA
ncbi:MAG TPA: CapA family protein [Nocardioidaceae bacterium]|nr:CapA family protein [Nocardioidaceae bacterium]